MGFLEGLVTGAATSVNEQLKKDMERSQERAEGMAQYRVTRRRAAVERQEKEKKELEDTLNNLASLVDGDIDKAAQLYINGGKNITGANALYQELLKNKQAGIDISTAITFAENVAPEGTTMQDYVSKFVTPITKLPDFSKGEVQGAGLYGALFKPDLGASVRRQVEEAAPLPSQEAPDLNVQMAKIDRSGFLDAKKAAQADEEFKMTKGRYESDMQAAQSRMDIANKNYELALEKFQADKDNTELEQALRFAADARDATRLDLAVAKAKSDAEQAVLTRDLTKLSIDERKFELNKKKTAPEFATFELMLVSAEENLARATSPEETLIYEKQRAHAIKGLADIAKAKDTDVGTTTAVFSKQSVDSIINAEIKRQLEPVGLVKDIDGRLDYAISGNEVQYFERMTRALDAVEYRVTGIDDSQMTNTIKSSREGLATDIAAYKRKQLGMRGFRPKIGTDLESIATAAFDNNAYKAGDIIEYEENGVKKHVLWTGSDLL